jgi:diketogulonate reductase-like aldo/keto reductase
MIPTHRLGNGDQVPGLGLGTFGSDKVSPTEVGRAVREAIDVGYRHFDCAAVYRNEAEVGAAIRDGISAGVPRDSIWVTSKVWNDRHDNVERACEDSLRDLGLDYLDLYLVHWPFPNHHAPGVSVLSRDPHAVPFHLDQYMSVWAQMERLVRRGIVRHIGTSNMTIRKLQGLLDRAEIRPECNELELHPHFQQPELRAFLKQNEILGIGYSPIGSPSRPERDRTPEDSVDVEDPAIVSAAERLNVHPAVVCVLWQVQLGTIPIPFSVKRNQFEATFHACTNLRLTEDEMERIARADRNCRLIKGQVFLWEGANDWHDLWDE